MMNNKKNVPDIRFKGFADEWNNEALGKLASFSKGRGYSKGDLVEKGTPIVLYGRLYTKYQTVISDVDTFAIQKKDSVLSKGVEVVVPASGETAEDISRASAIIKPNTIIAGDLNIIYPNSEMDSVFLALSISNGDAQKNLSKKAQGKSVVHLHNSDLDGIELKYPVVDEQKAIGNYFQNIDRLINTSQTKLDKLKNIKKACLEKMFPRNGSTTPEFRFKGFIEEWKEQQLGDCADIVGGGTPDTANSEYWDGDIDWYSPAEIGDKIFVDRSKRKITQLGLKESSAKVLPIGTVLFSSRAGIGSTAILAKEGATNQGFQSIIPHNGKLDTYFIFSRTRELKKYGETNGAGSTFIEVSGKQMESMTIINPEIDEQKAIGIFFKNLDRLTAKTEQQINKLKNIKRACLDKMFVNE